MENKPAEQMTTEKLNIEESREKRLERIKAKRRDRGGIFKPREDNPLLDILMSRDVSGRSPSKSRSKPRRPSAASSSSSRGNARRASNAMESRAIDRNKSVATKTSTSVAGKQRRRSEAPPSSDNERIVIGKTKPTNASRTSSKQSEKSDSAEGRLPVISSKRSREDVETEAADADLPSPPKRLKRSTTSAPAAKTVSKPAVASRKPSSASKSGSEAKAKTPLLSVRQNSHDMDGDAPVRPECTQVASSTARNRGRPKGTKRAESSKEAISDGNGRLTALDSISNRTVPSRFKTTNKVQPAAKRKASMKDESISDGEGRKTTKTTKNSRKTKTKPREKDGGKGKKKAEPEPEPEPDSDSDQESEEERHLRMMIPKPRLDTVIEEDEDEEPAKPMRNNNDNVSALLRKNDPRIQLESASKARGNRKLEGKQKAKEIDNPGVSFETTAEGSTKVTTKSNSRSQTKAQVQDAVHSEHGAMKPSSRARRKAKDTAPTSKRPSDMDSSYSNSKPARSKAASRTTSKSSRGKSKQATSRSTSKPTTRTTQTMPKPEVAKQAGPTTLLFSSPIKAADNEDDEIDFLS